jgi:16S rRNA (cytosine967-C5)-methyltransferase
MKESARFQTIIEILEDNLNSNMPLDNALKFYFKANRFIGSKDRRFISEYIWEIIRNKLKAEFVAKDKSARNILISYFAYFKYFTIDDLNKIFDGEKYSPKKLSVDEIEHINYLSEIDIDIPDYVRAETPEWLFKKIKSVYGKETNKYLSELNKPATADFRVNSRNLDRVIEDLKLEGLDFIKTPISPIGIRSENRININNCLSFKDGSIEVQDEASQIASILCDVKEGEEVIDYCAGACGKSLAIASVTNNKANLYAHDINDKRLLKSIDRIKRAGAKIELLHHSDFLKLNKKFDRFIIDAPCSGTGTWRRSPDAKFRLTEEELNRIISIQKEVLDIAYQNTKSGGHIVYITCSILKDENEEQIEYFMNKYGDIKQIDAKNIWDKKISLKYPSNDKYLRLSPCENNTDGFFISIFKKD